MKFLVLFAISLVAVNAIPFKRNDMPEKIKAAEEDSSKDLEQFVRAFNEGDKPTLFELSKFIIDIAKRGQDNSKKQSANMSRLLRVLNAGAHRGWLGSLLVRELAWLIDGNRDNESYYDLETVIQWVEKRQARGVHDQDLDRALAAAKESQEHLQNMAGTFVEDIKRIRKEPSAIPEIVDHIVKTVQENDKPHLHKYQEVMDALNNFQYTQGV